MQPRSSIEVRKLEKKGGACILTGKCYLPLNSRLFGKNGTAEDD